MADEKGAGRDGQPVNLSSEPKQYSKAVLRGLGTAWRGRAPALKRRPRAHGPDPRPLQGWWAGRSDWGGWGGPGRRAVSKQVKTGVGPDRRSGSRY